MAFWAARIPSSKVASWLISVANSSVGLMPPPLISEKWVVRFLNARLASASAFLMAPTVTMA